jgi:diguanylate cyclase (GGDEF)-like protein
VNLRGWDLWALRPRVIGYVIVVELLAVSWLVYATLTGPVPSSRDWSRLGMLAAGALTHVHLSRRVEERRRSDGSKRHIDVSSIWSFPAALILPIPLVAALIAATRVQRHQIARKPPHKALLSASSMMLAGFVAHAIAGAGVDLWPGPQWDEGLVILLAAGTYCLQQVLVVGAAILLEADRRPPLTAVFGGAQQWREMYLAISLGIAVALSAAHPILIVLMVGVGVGLNRLVGSQADAEHEAREARRAVKLAQDDARTDKLTGLWNKAGWDRAAARRLRDARDHGRSYAVALVDLDRFKRVNDTLGHLVGNEVLQAVAHVLAQNVRDGDVVGRFGGEELVIALPDADADEARQVAERLLTGIRAIRIPTTRMFGGEPVIVGGPQWPCTASIGVVVSTSVVELDALLDRADQAMYRAKNSGRDQVVITGHAPATHVASEPPATRETQFTNRGGDTQGASR